MMAGFMLNGLALLISMDTIASYCPKIQRNAATLRPRREQSLMVAALAFGSQRPGPGPTLPITPNARAHARRARRWPASPSV
jgi:hypothetical protein